LERAKKAEADRDALVKAGDYLAALLAEWSSHETGTPPKEDADALAAWYALRSTPGSPVVRLDAAEPSSSEDRTDG
jgi:hypothetical protein